MSENFWGDIAIAILAGGQSTRMGQDKAALQIGGEPLLVRTVRLASATRAPVCVMGRARPGDWPRDIAADFAPDEEPGQGPLGGLLSALRWNALSINRRPRLLLLPCDLPLLESGALDWIAGASGTCAARHGLATTREERLEPMFSIYFSAAEALAREYLASGRRSLHGLIESGDFESRECPAQVARQLFNCNTLQDVETARRMSA